MAKLLVGLHDAWVLGMPDESDIVENDSIDESERARVRDRGFVGAVRALASQVTAMAAVALSWSRLASRHH